MRTRKFLAGATFLVGVGAAAQANAQLLLKGSDTLEDVSKDAIIAASVSNITYVGGGSGGGQAAMTATIPTQQIAPMSRQLNGTACTNLGATIGQELIGLDGIAVVGANQTGGDSDAQSGVTTDDCNDNITGGLVLNVPGCTANDGCDASANYTFSDWKDVLAMVYGGQNHNKQCGGDTTVPSTNGNLCTLNSQCGVGTCAAIPAIQPAGAASPNARDPRKVNCNSSVRRTLVDSWGSLFSTGTGVGACRSGQCTKLRHAFRRDDISGTTDTFVTLIGMAAIPPYTTTFDATLLLPRPDSKATANAFCNAGDGLMNKGDSDYLDLDPIRRAVDQVAGVRTPLEQVGQAGLPAFGGNNTDANCIPANAVPPTDNSASSVPNLLPFTPSSPARLQQELGFPGGGSAALNPFTRTCLGLVLPIAMPGNYLSTDAYFGASADGTVPPVPCSIDPVTGTPVMANKILDTTFTASLCSDGKTQPCRVPVNNSTGTNNFNCYLDALNPTILPLRDNRGFHLHPVTNGGLYKRDNYVNPNIPIASIGAGRQNRVVTAFYRMHFTHSTNINGSVPTLPAGQGCRLLSATTQIGCLVKANACDIGYAGREAVDVFSTGPKNMAFRLNDIAGSVTNIQNLVTTPLSTADDYPLARGLYVNAANGFAGVANGTFGGNELDLLNFFRTPASIDPIIAARNFIVVPASVTRSSGCPRP